MRCMTGYPIRRTYDHCSKCGVPTPPNASPRCSGCHYLARKEREDRAKQILGGRCVRCGIRHPLVWDHINDDGYQTRNDFRPGARRPNTVARQRQLRNEVAKILRTRGSDVFQLLCFNCNYLKSFDREEYDRPPAYGPLDPAVQAS